MHAHLRGPVLQLPRHGERLGVRLEADALLCSRSPPAETQGLQCCMWEVTAELVRGTLMGARGVLASAGTTQIEAPSPRARRSPSFLSSVLKSVSRKACTMHL